MSEARPKGIHVAKHDSFAAHFVVLRGRLRHNQYRVGIYTLTPEGFLLGLRGTYEIPKSHPDYALISAEVANLTAALASANPESPAESPR